MKAREEMSPTYKLVQHYNGVTRFKRVENLACKHTLRKKTSQSRSRVKLENGNSFAI